MVVLTLIFQDYLIQLEASYLQFVAAYIRHRRPNYSDISASFSSRLLESLSTVLVITKIIKRKQVNMSEVDPDSLPSYGVVARGGNAVHPVFKDAKMINLLTQYTRCLRFCPKKMVTFLVTDGRKHRRIRRVMVESEKLSKKFSVFDSLSRASLKS